MRILVTGGTGFLGKRLVRHLLSQGQDVCCLARPSSDNDTFRAAVEVPDGGRLDVVHGGLNRLESCCDALQGCDVVIHAAAAMTGGASVMFVNNVVATRQLISLVPRLGVRRFVLVSSLAVYESGTLKQGAVLDERCPLDRKAHLRDQYSFSKIAQEKVAWESHAQGRLPLVVIRPGVIYGPGRGCLSARIGLQFGSLMVRMGGRQQVPYTYVDNCAAAIGLTATAPGIEGEAFNIIDDDLPTARSVLAQYRREVQRLRVVPIPQWAIGPLSGFCERYHTWSNGQLPAVLTRHKSNAHWRRLTYSNAKAKSILGWVPQITFADGLRQTCDWSRRALESRSGSGSITNPAPEWREQKQTQRKTIKP